MKRSRSASLLTLGLAACGLLAACGGPERPARPEGSALWAGSGAVAALPPGTLERLREAGVRELFVPAAELAWDGGAPRLEVTLEGPLPRRVPATLVVSGAAPPGGSEEEAEAAGEALGRELARLRLAAEGRGLLAVGVHLDLASPSSGSLARLAEVVEAARPELGEGLFLSARLDPERIGDPEAERLAAAADFLVCPLYGQRPEELEEEARWRIDSVVERVAALEALGADYLVGVATLGAAYRLGPDGGLRDATATADLVELVRNRSLERTQARLLEGWDRRVLSFAAERPTEAAGWRLETGEGLRAVQVQGRDVVELRRRLRALELEHHLGELYYRAPEPGEGLALTLPVLADALLGVPADADLRVELRDARRTAGGLVFRVALVNAGDGPTDVALYANNYVELRVPGGSLPSVTAGGFRRYAMMLGGREATDMRSFRDADTVRLYATLVGAGEEVVSGPIEARLGPAGTIEAGGLFALPGGDEHALPESRWP